MRILFPLLFSICLPIIALRAAAQEQPDSLRIYRVDTNDGNIFTGHVISETADTLILKTDKLGVLRLAVRDIRDKTAITGATVRNGVVWLPNPQSSRYFWAPNGYGLKTGEAYYQNIWIFYNQASFGLTDNFSLGVGLMPLFLFGVGATPIWVVPKFSIPLVENKWNLGTGAFLGTVIGEQTGIFGLLYGTSTFGSRDRNFSVGLAYGFGDGEWMDIPVINVSGLIRTGPRGYFITENYFISAEGEFAAIISIGGRSIIRSIGVDYSLWIPAVSGMETFVAAPFLGLTIPISKTH